MTIRQLFTKLSRPTDWLALKKVESFTMVGHDRLYGLIDLVRQVEQENLPGAVVECGVWKGGAAAIMARTIKRFGYRRALWLFDSFAGLPAPSAADGEKAAAQYAADRGESSVADVLTALAKFDIDPAFVTIVPGWFDQTLPAKRSAIGPIALLRLDSDWYESTKTCLQTLADQVVPGGFIVIDDYGTWPGARQAVDEFLASQSGSVINVRTLADGSVFWRTPVLQAKASYWAVETKKYETPHRRLKRLADELNRLPLSAGKVLDLGCGPGTLGRLLDRSRLAYAGVDVFPQPDFGGRYGQFDLENGPWSDFPFAEKFDAIVLSGVMEYLSAQRLAELFRFIKQNLLKPDGIILASYTNFDHYARQALTYHPAWTTVWSIKQLTEFWLSAGYQVVRKYPSYYFVFNRRVYSPRWWLGWLSRRFGRQIIFSLKTND